MATFKPRHCENDIEHPLMDHLTTICRTIRALHTLHRVAVITDNVATITEELSEQLACIGTPEDVITSEDALVLQLVQQIAMPSTPLDVSLAAALAAPLAHLGPQAASLSPPALLALQPASTVNASFSAVLHILHGALSPSTCFTLLGAAYHLDAPCLFRAAHTLCVANFTTAQQLDAQGLATLPLPVLKVLLRDQGLRVDSELQVFQAAASWVTASPAHRLPILRPLLVECVRIGDMPVEQLAELDQDPLVASVPECTRLVAHAYLSRYLGSMAGPGRGSLEESHPEPELLGCEASLAAWEGPLLEGPLWEGALQRSPVSHNHKRRRVVAPGAARRAIVLPC